MFLCVLTATAAPGDTTWVQAQYGTNLDWFGNYDTAITFPNGSTTYRKVYMVFTLGKHPCPGYDPNNAGDGAGQTGWCGDWDYTVQNYIMTPGGDTLEIGRFITPYARENAPRTPLTWTQRYYYDVTDYYPVLKNNATMRIFYSGYSGGFTANVKFAFIEGTPDRDVKDVDRLWNGSFGYGGAIPIDTNFQLVNKTAPAGTQSADLRFTISGHGSDANQCCEFLSRYYEVMLNNAMIAHKDIWRSDCGANDLYPQSGTWLLERANWCPGAIVWPAFYNLAGVTGGNNFSTEINFQPYTGGGSYTTEAQLFYYGGMNKTLDASVEDIIAPTDYEGYFRANPVCGSPTIKIRNSGSTAISSVHIQYGEKSMPMSDYTWNGSIASLKDTIITLPTLPYLDTIGDNNTHTFVVKILDVNGVADDDSTNNGSSTTFKPAPQWPNKFIITLNTNNQTDNNGNCETSWQLFDNEGNIVKQRINNAINSYLNDTVVLGVGCYKLVVTDGSCDGLHWWLYDANPNLGINSGSIKVRRVSQIPNYFTLNGNPAGGYHDDFGCGFTQYFTTLGFPASVTNLSEIPLQIEAFPNPAQNTVNVSISGMPNISGTVQLIDALGRVVLQKECKNAYETLNTGSLSNGMYTIIFTDKNDPSARLQTRLLIAK